MPGAPIWPLSVEAYRALGEAGLMPKNTELLNPSPAAIRSPNRTFRWYKGRRKTFVTGTRRAQNWWSKSA